jgi:hypothetical protein
MAKVSSHGTPSGFALAAFGFAKWLRQSIDSVVVSSSNQFRRLIRFDPFSFRDCTE